MDLPILGPGKAKKNCTITDVTRIRFDEPKIERHIVVLGQDLRRWRATLDSSFPWIAVPRSVP
jgi:hypothetical protein